MKNEKWYKETFDKVHVPDELLGKVMDMENQTKKTAKRGWRYAMGALAAAFGLFVASNGICYAATGETWVSRMTLWINGEKVEKDITWQDNGDGTFLGTVEMDDDKETLIVLTDAPNVTKEDGEVTYSFDGEGIEEFYSTDCVVEEDEDGSVWMRVREDGMCKAEADITADLADGYAEGDIAGGDGITFHYQVTQTEAGEYELVLSAELSAE